jgi:hypothetical protein
MWNPSSGTDLLAQVLHRVAVALFADGGLVHRPGRFAQLGGDLGLDRQAVAIPPRHIRGPITAHGLDLDDEILEGLVDDMAHVDVAVGIRRAVVQDIERGVLAGFENFGVDILLGPGLALDGLALHQVGLHREGRVRQVQCVFVAVFGVFLRHSDSSRQIRTAMVRNAARSVNGGVQSGLNRGDDGKLEGPVPSGPIFNRP